MTTADLLSLFAACADGDEAAGGQLADLFEEHGLSRDAPLRACRLGRLPYGDDSLSIAYRLRDSSGNLVEEDEVDALTAAEKAYTFVLLQGSDPDEGGRGASNGSVEFSPAEPSGDDDCHLCGGRFVVNPDGTANHVDDDGGRDYESDADHVPYAL